MASISTRRGDRELEVPRADLCALLVESARGVTEPRLNDTVTSLRPDDHGVDVSIRTRPPPIGSTSWSGPTDSTSQSLARLRTRKRLRHPLGLRKGNAQRDDGTAGRWWWPGPNANSLLALRSARARTQVANGPGTILRTRSPDRSRGLSVRYRAAQVGDRGRCSRRRRPANVPWMWVLAASFAERGRRVPGHSSPAPNR